MTSPYRPQQGSIPARVIDHLNLTGGTMTRAAIANGFAIEPKNVDGNLASSIKHGLIVRHQAEGMKTCYGLPGSTPGEDAPAPPASMTINSSAHRTAVAERAQKTKKTRAPAATSDVVDTMPSDGAPLPAPPPPIAALWEDGDVVLYGLQINADDTVTLSGHQAKRVHRFMERCFGPNE